MTIWAKKPFLWLLIHTKYVQDTGKMHISRAFALCAAQKPWRESASVLLVAPTLVSGQQKLSLLTMKRSRNSSFMPNGIVFPGGAVSSADSSPAWIKLFEKAGNNVKEVRFLHRNAHRPDIYHEDASNERLPREVSLRITAIREAFEECGVLLSRSIIRKVDQGTPAEEIKNPNFVAEWQKTVKDDPEAFLVLCEKISVVPDLHGLFEWSNFLTPTTFENRQRFDTIFYMAIVPQQLTVTIDAQEAEEAEWTTAENLLERHHKGEIQLMPPQYYEMTRLKNIHSTAYLEKLLDSRRRLGIERWLPVMVRTDDGMLSLLPGDDLYPEHPNIYEGGVKMPKLDKTTDDLNKSTVRHHRFAKGASGPMKILTSVQPKYGQYYCDL